MNYTRVIFISYSSADRDLAKALADSLESLGALVQFEDKSTAETASWKATLEQIRTADVFVFTLTNHTLESEARMLEYHYAQSLQKPIFGVQLAAVDLDGMTDFTAVFDYRRPQVSQLRLIREALDALPDDMVRMTQIPLPDWSAALDRVGSRFVTAEAGAPLTPETQRMLVRNLRDFAEREETHEAALKLAAQFASLPDLSPETRRDVNALLHRGGRSGRGTPLGLSMPAVSASNRQRIVLNVIASLILLAALVYLLSEARRENDRLLAANPTAVSLRVAELTATRDTEALLQQTATADAITAATGTQNAIVRGMTATVIAGFTDTPTATSTPTATPTITPTATDTATLTATSTFTATATFTASATATATSTPAVTPTPTATDTSEPSATPSLSPTSTPSRTATATHTATYTATSTLTSTPTSTSTHTPTPSNTPTPTLTSTPTPDPNLELIFDGITVADTTLGVRVSAVGPAAENAGVMVGDIIVSVDDTEIRTSDRFAEVTEALEPGDSVTLRIRRNGIVLIRLTFDTPDFLHVTSTPTP